MSCDPTPGTSWGADRPWLGKRGELTTCAKRQWVPPMRTARLALPAPLGASIRREYPDLQFRMAAAHAICRRCLCGRSSDVNSWADVGEHGEIRDGFPATRWTLGSIRRAEDEAAWRAIGRVPDRHEWLGLPDGGVADVPFDELVAAVARILEEEDPAVVVTFGPEGIFGHPDHIAIGAATYEAFARLRSNDGSGFQRLAHGAVPAVGVRTVEPPAG